MKAIYKFLQAFILSLSIPLYGVAYHPERSQLGRDQSNFRSLSVSINPPQWLHAAAIPRHKSFAKSDFYGLFKTVARAFWGRFGGNFEYLFKCHHGIILTPFWTIQPTYDIKKYDCTLQVKSLKRVKGVEANYRWYSGCKGPNGFWISPGFTFLTTTYQISHHIPADVQLGNDVPEILRTPKETEITLTGYGLSFDIGYQYVFDGGVTIGVGAGCMKLWFAEKGLKRLEEAIDFISGYYNYSKHDDDKSWLKDRIVEPLELGLFPRFLFSVGYSF